jgi:phosphatidylglycerophosphate synthase
VLENIRKTFEKYIRAAVRQIARGIHAISRGHIRPNDITIAGLFMHIPIAVLVALNHLYWAAGLLIVFGLFDTLDGELARLQKRVSDIGGFLDTVSDRVKELLLYAGIIYLFAENAEPSIVLLMTILACGTSLITPFVKAKGEAIIATYGHELSYDKLNRMFGGGILPYEVRILSIVAGLLLGMQFLPWVVTIIAVLATLTMVERLLAVVRSIR